MLQTACVRNAQLYSGVYEVQDSETPQDDPHFSLVRGVLLQALRDHYDELIDLCSRGLIARDVAHLTKPYAWITDTKSAMPYSCSWCCDILLIEQEQIISHLSDPRRFQMARETVRHWRALENGTGNSTKEEV